MAKTAIFFANGFEEIEALTVVDLLRRTGIEINMVSVTGEKTVTGSHNITISTESLIEDIDFDDLDMIILPGGMPGTINLESCGRLQDAIADFDKKGKLLSAICAAPGVFGRKGILNGRKASIFPGLEAELKGAEVSYDEVTVDGHFTTSRGMGTAIPFGLAIIARFQGKEAADAMADKIVYKR
ncbi:MAG: DJ-1/PfpI family protein [Butyrivibrio sp.]|nr:DJ-1/PfpI family protein [Butyrivibrio sp.]